MHDEEEDGPGTQSRIEIHDNQQEEAPIELIEEDEEELPLPAQRFPSFAAQAQNTPKKVTTNIDVIEYQEANDDNDRLSHKLSEQHPVAKVE